MVAPFLCALPLHGRSLSSGLADAVGIVAIPIGRSIADIAASRKDLTMV